MSKEIVTLSFGRLANYTCSHLWNFQASAHWGDLPGLGVNMPS